MNVLFNMMLIPGYFHGDYMLYAMLHRFWRVARFGIPPSAMAFTSLSKDELVVAFTDNTLRCYDIGMYNIVCHTIIARKVFALVTFSFC